LLAPLPGDGEPHHRGADEAGRVVHVVAVLVEADERVVGQVLGHGLAAHQQEGQAGDG